jgi:hypothetical protein
MLIFDIFRLFLFCLLLKRSCAVARCVAPKNGDKNAALTLNRRGTLNIILLLCAVSYFIRSVLSIDMFCFKVLQLDIL